MGDSIIPSPLADDDDDVAWALQTAAVQWQRGGHEDAVVWIRRAVDAAITAGNAKRTKELAELASALSERIRQGDFSTPEATSAGPGEIGESEPDATEAPPVSEPSSAITGRPGPDQARVGAAPRPASSIPVSGTSPPSSAPIDIDDLPDLTPEEFEEPGAPSTGERRISMFEAEQLAEKLSEGLDDIPDLSPDEFKRSSARPPARASVRPPPAPSMRPPPAPSMRPPPAPSSLQAQPAASVPPLASPPGPTAAVRSSTLPAARSSAPPAAARSSAPPPGSEAPPSADSLRLTPPPESPRLSESRAPKKEVSEHPSGLETSPAEEGKPVVDGVSLEEVQGLQDLPEEAQMELARTATITTLSVDEEVGAFGAALVTRGRVGIMSAIADVAAGFAGPGEIVFTRGSLADGNPLRVVAMQDDTCVASWSPKDLDAKMSDSPWVADELRHVADRFQALAGGTLGPLGDSLDDSLRALVLPRLEVKSFEPGELIVEQGSVVPGLHVVGGGAVELLDAGNVVEELGPGEFVFATQVLSAGSANRTARAAETGALVLFASRAAAHELLLSVPPLIEILAG